MKNQLVMVMALVFCLPFLGFSTDDGYYSGSFGRLNYVNGDVFIQRVGDLGYEKGEINLALVEGDKLGTREGRAEVQLNRKNYLRVDDFTQVEFVNLPQTSGDVVKVHVLSGNIFLRVQYLEREKNIEIHTPDASFYILEEGLYRVNVRENEKTEFYVYEGNAEAAGKEGSLLIKSDERLVASNGSLGSHVSLSSSDEDDFTRWNESRESLQRSYVADRYLPNEIEEYESELADNGRWAYERPYGYVWVPYVSHIDWHPYYYGRWSWYPIIGWTWISSEPWGWCAYHYGRWHWRLGLGWYWIPTRYWGPAWVHWYHHYDYIGWCPLSYYNRPVVVVNNYFYDRYNGDYYPYNNRALTIVRKDQLQSPHMSRLALSQTQVASLGKISLQARQPEIKPVLKGALSDNPAAAKVFSDSRVRKVEKNFAPAGGASPSSKSGLSGLRSPTRGTSGDFSSDSRGTILRKNSAESGRIGPSSLGRDESRSSIKSYPSGRISSSGSSRSRENSSESSPSGIQGTISPRKIRSDSSESRSSVTFPSRLTGRTSSSVERSSSRSSVSSSPSFERFKSYPSSQRITRKSSDDSYRSPSSSSYSPSRSQGYIRENSGSIGSRIREWSSRPSDSGSRSVSTRRSSPSSSESPRVRSYSYDGPSSSRSYSAPARSYSPSRSFSSPSSSPSRSFSPSRPSFSAPSSSSRSFSRGSSGLSSSPRSSSSGSRPSSGSIRKKN